MKKLSELLKNVEHEVVCGEDVEIENIVIDSRKAVTGSLFACISGTQRDGHKYIQMAADNGAKAVIIEKDTDYPEGLTVVKLFDTRKALDEIAACFYDYPARSLRMIGVTGTNGKTSVTYFIEQILAENGNHPGVIGTIEQRLDQKPLDFSITTSTTPDTVELQELLSIMRRNGATDVVMEVSSHALELKKVEGMNFAVSIFTNLTQDHLDFHKTMDAYAEAKAKLFSQSNCSIINADSDYADKIFLAARDKVVTYGVEHKSAVKAYEINYEQAGTAFKADIEGKAEDFYIAIPGKFSLYNALAAVAASLELGIGADVIRKGLKKITGVRGRIQRVTSDKDFSVFVDYAHSPDGLKNIISSVREFTEGRIIIVFGCGGERDRTKRPIMGRIAAELADYCVVTSDNPRSERPEAIIEEILVGVKSGSAEFEAITDRKEAIFKGIQIAKKGDSVIIAGKGHENYQVLATETIHFDDYETAEIALAETGRA